MYDESDAFLALDFVSFEIEMDGFASAVEIIRWDIYFHKILFIEVCCCHFCCQLLYCYCNFFLVPSFLNFLPIFSDQGLGIQISSYSVAHEFKICSSKLIGPLPYVIFSFS